MYSKHSLFGLAACRAFLCAPVVAISLTGIPGICIPRMFVSAHALLFLNHEA